MTMNRTEIERKFEEVMDEFDFHKVINVMELLNWTWYGDATQPSVVEMKKNCRGLLKTVLDVLDEGETRQMWSSSGGFEVSYDNRYDYLTLKFVVEDSEYNSEYEEE